MSTGLLVDMAFWTFKTIISFFFFRVWCFSTGKQEGLTWPSENKNKKRKMHTRNNQEKILNIR